ncbi:MAG TPA: phosphatidate cytidylyltransferase [Burkholderiaceae bacterium]
MLRTRVITALALLALLLPVLYFNYFPGFAVLVLAFFAAAIWENGRLFGKAQGTVAVYVWTALFALILFKADLTNAKLFFALCVAIWAIRLAPALGLKLPAMETFANKLLGSIYGIAILGCFVAIVQLFRHSPLYLLSVLALVWLADIGAYFCGKAFGKRKLAITISPGKSWEGAIGGAIVVMLACVAVVLTASGQPLLQDTFVYRLFAAWGWAGMALVIAAIVAASVVGDLFESMLKRRAGMKDSSNLLPGHGGVLDRIDALIPVLPLAALVDSFF